MVLGRLGQLFVGPDRGNTFHGPDTVDLGQELLGRIPTAWGDPERRNAADTQGGPDQRKKGNHYGFLDLHDRLRREGRLLLTDTSTYGTFVNDVKVAGETELAVGQSIRVGSPGEKLQVITCLENDETPLA